MDTIRFEWDENKNSSNKVKHGISFEEALTVFYDEDALYIDAPSHSEEEERFIILGVSQKRKSACGLSLLQRIRNGSPHYFGTQSHQKRVRTILEMRCIP